MDVFGFHKNLSGQIKQRERRFKVKPRFLGTHRPAIQLRLSQIDMERIGPLRVGAAKHSQLRAIDRIASGIGYQGFLDNNAVGSEETKGVFFKGFDWDCAAVFCAEEKAFNGNAVLAAEFLKESHRYRFILARVIVGWDGVGGYRSGTKRTCPEVGCCAMAQHPDVSSSRSGGIFCDRKSLYVA